MRPGELEEDELEVDDEVEQVEQEEDEEDGNEETGDEEDRCGGCGTTDCDRVVLGGFPCPTHDDD